MKLEMLEEAERKGWMIKTVTDGVMRLQCPSQGCGLNVNVREGGHIPQCDPGFRRDLRDIKVESYEEIRDILIARRRHLLLAMEEVGDIAGLAAGHVGKFEQNKHSQNQRRPSIDSTLYWIQALGYDMVLRPAPFTKAAKRIIADTRRNADYRHNKMFKEPKSES